MRRLIAPCLAVVLALVAEIGLIVDHGWTGSSHTLQVVFAALGCAPIALVWVRPLLAMVLVAIVLALEAALVTPPQLFGEGLAAVVVCFAAGAWGERRRLPVAVIVFLAAGAFRDLRDPRYDVGDMLADAVLFLMFVAVGVAVSTYRRRSARSAGEAELARTALSDERGRLARELHDIVAHSVSVMVIQATAAGPRAGDPESQETFAAIESAGRQALVELRRLLGVLRAEDHTPLALAPQPGLAEIPALVERVRATGQPVRVHIEGHARSLSPSIELSAYRVVQEALTNAVKHASGARTDVRLSHTDHELVIEVINDGSDRECVADGAGRGLAGLRERVDLYDGQLETGKRDGGFVLRATLPAR